MSTGEERKKERGGKWTELVTGTDLFSWETLQFLSLHFLEITLLQPPPQSNSPASKNYFFIFDAVKYWFLNQMCVCTGQNERHRNQPEPESALWELSSPPGKVKLQVTKIKVKVTRARIWPLPRFTLNWRLYNSLRPCLSAWSWTSSVIHGPAVWSMDHSVSC